MADASAAASTAADFADKAAQAAILTQVLKKAGVSGWGILAILLFHFASLWYWGSRLEEQISTNQQATDERFALLEKDEVDLKDIMVMQFLSRLAPVQAAPPIQAAPAEP